MGFCFLFFWLVFQMLVLTVDSVNKKVKFVTVEPSEKPPKITFFNILDSLNNTTENVQLGSTAELPCYVKYPTAALNVTWWKVNSSELLTTNNKTNSEDKRFQAALKEENTHKWLLRIRYTKDSDEGLYKCQLEGDFVASIFITLHLKKARAVIKGSKSGGIRYVVPGTTLRLSCYLQDFIEYPSYIFWYKGDRVINYDLDEGQSIREGRQGSELIVPTAKESHSGNYSCVPSNAEQAYVIVEVTTKVREKVMFCIEIVFRDVVKIVRAVRK